MAPALEVPAAWFASAPELPDRCVRHGLPAARRVDFVVKSRPKLSPWRRTLLPGYSSLDRAAEYAGAVKLTRVSGWPLCPRCGRVRTAGLALANVLFFGGVATLIASFILRALADGPQPMLLVPMLDGFTAMLVSPVALRWGGLPRLTQTQTTADGTAVRITEPHPEFAGQLRRLAQP